jgi:hypothetical protein
MKKNAAETPRLNEESEGAQEQTRIRETYKVDEHNTKEKKEK